MPPPSYTRPMRDRCSQCHCEQRSDEAISFYFCGCPERCRGEATPSMAVAHDSLPCDPRKRAYAWFSPTHMLFCGLPPLPAFGGGARGGGCLGAAWAPRTPFARTFPAYPLLRVHSPLPEGEGSGVRVLWTRITPASPTSKNAPLLARVPHLPYLLMSSQLSCLRPGIVPHCFSGACIAWAGFAWPFSLRVLGAFCVSRSSIIKLRSAISNP